MIIENYIDLCSGTGCFPHAMKRAGIEIKNHYFSEIDKYAIQNYRYNFPKAIYIGAIGHFLDNTPKRADFISFGFPCQDLSIAGKRKGISAGTRSGLVFQIAEVLKHYKPRHFFAENVQGVLSHAKGSTIMEILNLFTDLGTDSMQYEVEMQFLNTRNFGIPQNRERLYFIGHNLATRGSGQKILPITQSDCGIDEGTTETAIVATITAGGHSGGHHSGMTLLETEMPIIAVNGNGNLRQVPVSSCGHADANVVVQINPSKESGGKQPYQQNRVYDAEGIMPAYNSQLTRGGSIVAINEVKQKKYTKGNSQAQRVYDLNGIAPTQGALGGGQGADRGLFEFDGKTIRRFTPIEVERLFGLPDNWTKFGINEKGETVEISDTQRYKLCGNGIPQEPLTTIFIKFYHVCQNQ